MNFLSSLFFSLMFIRMVQHADTHHGGQCPIPINLILDEFCNIGTLGADDGRDFNHTLSTVRSYGIKIMMFAQGLGQLQDRYRDKLSSEIIANTDIQLMLGCTDKDDTARYFSERSGEVTIEVESNRTNRKTFAVAQIITDYQHTEGQGKRYLLTKDEVLRLGHDELLICVSHCNILKAQKFDYTEHPMSKQISQTPIMEYIPIRLLTESSDDSPHPSPRRPKNPQSDAQSDRQHKGGEARQNNSSQPGTDSSASEEHRTESKKPVKLLRREEVPDDF